MRLWELEGGDEGGQIAFAGGRAAQEVQVARNGLELAEIALEEAIVGDDGVDNGGGRNVNVEPERPIPNENGAQVDVAREGPLVLRIDAGALPARGGRGGNQQAAAPQQARGGAQNRNRRNPEVARQQQHQAQQGQRGRGGRGRGLGNRQNQNQGLNRGAQNLARRERHVDEQLLDEAGREELHAGEAAWIRHFVQLALNDNEHLLDGDE